MSLEKVYEDVAKQNSELLNKFTYYLCSTNNILLTDLDNMSITSLKNEIKRILKHIRFANYDLDTIEYQIRKEALMIECFRQSFYVSGENYDGIGSGRNNGLIKNNIEEMQISNMVKEEEMLREQAQRFAKRDLLKKSLDDNSKMIHELIDIIPNDLYRKIVYDFYLNDLATAQLSQKYNIAYDYVGKAQARGLDSLAKIYKNYLNYLN